MASLYWEEMVTGIITVILLIFWGSTSVYPGWREIEDLHQSAGIRCLPSRITPGIPEKCNVLPKIYAQVKHFPVPVYGGITEPYLLKPKRLLHRGFVWVSIELEEVIRYKGRVWIKINPDEFIERRYLVFHAPSTFKGVEIDRREVSLPLVWLILDTTPSRVPDGPIDYKAPAIPKYTIFPVKRVKYINGLNWYEVGKNQWINQKRLALVQYNSRPKGVGPGQKWIYVDLYEQTLVAYDGDIPVYATLISSGVKKFPTVEGLFRIWLKVKEKKMSGGENTPDFYYLEDVPWQMYFYKGYAIHSSYWHDRFGIPQSNGCVNVAPYDAWWLYHWTEPRMRPGQKSVRASKDNPGTWVFIVQ